MRHTRTAPDPLPFAPLPAPRALLAGVLDGLGIGALVGGVALALPRLAGPAGTAPRIIAAVAIVMVSAWLLAWWRTQQATPALALLGGRIIAAATGEAPSWGQWARRLLGVLLAALTLGLALLPAGRGGAGRGLPDRLAGTRVVARGPRGGAPRTPLGRVLLGWLGALALTAAGAGVVITAFHYLTHALVLQTRTAAHYPDDATYQRLCPLPVAPPTDPAGRAARAAAAEKIAAAETRIAAYAGVASRLDSASNLLDSAVALDPCYAPVYVAYGRFFLRQPAGETAASLSRAAAAVQRARQLEPTLARAEVLAGFIALRQGDLPQCAHHLRQAEALGTDDPWLQNNWALWHEARGDYQEAALLYHAVSRRDDADSLARRFALDGLGQYFRRLGDLPNARHVIAERIRYAPDDAEGHAKQAEFLLCDLGDAREALAAAERALERQATPRTTTLLAQARVARWAELRLRLDRQQKRTANQLLLQAQQLNPAPPMAIIAGVCPGPHVAQQVAEAWAQQEAERTALAQRQADAAQRRAAAAERRRPDS